MLQPIFSLFNSSLNNLADNYNQRVIVTLEYRIPSIIYLALFLVTFFNMLVLDYQFGISREGNLKIFVILALNLEIIDQSLDIFF
jgi:hypothetical protein